MSESQKDIYQAVEIPDNLRKNKKIAIVTGDKVEDLEFFYPYYRLSEAGYQVDVITIFGGPFKGKKGLGLAASKAIAQVNPNDYQLLYLPGGEAPQRLRKDADVLKFVRSFVASNKPIASICHGAQILISADVVRGKIIATAPDVKVELEEAGGSFADEALQEDGQFITARKPGDLHRHLYGVIKVLEGKN